VFTDTVDVIEPSEFDEPVPPAFQFQATLVFEEPFIFELVPTVKPSVPKAVKPCDCVASALFASE